MHLYGYVQGDAVAIEPPQRLGRVVEDADEVPALSFLECCEGARHGQMDDAARGGDGVAVGSRHGRPSERSIRSSMKSEIVCSRISASSWTWSHE